MQKGLGFGFFFCICKGFEFQPKYECSHLKVLLWLLIIFTLAQLSHGREMMYNSKGTGMGFIGVIGGGLCWVQGKSVPTSMREKSENSEKSSANFDHCSSRYQISLLDLALQDSREETELTGECSPLTL